MIDQIEQGLIEQATATEFVWTAIAKGLIDIKNDELFRQAVDEQSGRQIKSFEAYLRRFSKKLKPVLSSGSVSTLKAWVYKQQVYVEQLGYTEDWLQEMGAHANILLRVANTGPKNILLAEDRELTNKGTKLGFHAFQVLCDRIHDAIVTATGPEDEWDIASTQAEVAKLLGSEPPVTKVWDVRLNEGNMVEILDVKYQVGDFEYSMGKGKSLVHLDNFLKIAKGPHHKVSGLPNLQ